jgi:hypothetical protein
MTGVSLTLIKCTPWVLVIVDPCPYGFASDFGRLCFICLAKSWMSSWPTLKLVFAYKFDSIWVIVDRLTRSAHFIPVNTNYNVQKYAAIYVAHVLCLHGVPEMILSDRRSQFVARFWEQLHASLKTHLIHSSAYHSRKANVVADTLSHKGHCNYLPAVHSTEEEATWVSEDFLRSRHPDFELS